MIFQKNTSLNVQQITTTMATKAVVQEAMLIFLFHSSTKQELLLNQIILTLLIVMGQVLDIQILQAFVILHQTS